MADEWPLLEDELEKYMRRIGEKIEELFMLFDEMSLEYLRRVREYIRRVREAVEKGEKLKGSGEVKFLMVKW